MVGSLFRVEPRGSGNFEEIVCLCRSSVGVGVARVRGQVLIVGIFFRVL